MKQTVDICFYGDFRPPPRRNLCSMMRCVLAPLFRRLGEDYEKAFFLHATMDTSNALPGISVMMNEFPFHEMALSPSGSLRRVMALLGPHVFRLVVCIRLDVFFTSPLHVSDVNLLLEEDSENCIFLPESPMDGLVIGSMRAMRLFVRDDSPTILRTQHQIRCVRLSIVMVRLASDGTVVAQDRSRCPYLDDLLASNE